MKTLLLISIATYFALFACQSIFAQNHESENISGSQWCGTPEITSQEYEDWISANMEKTLKSQANPQTHVVYNIPVIVHVIHNGEAIGTGTNISVAQVSSQFDVLNEIFRKLNSDWNKTPSIWQGLVADCEINWCKAKIDPTGKVLAEPGVERINRNSKGWSAAPYSLNPPNYVYATILPNSIWDPNKYCNIWVCDLANQVNGISYFPAASTLTGIVAPYIGDATNDGAVIDYATFGRVGTVLNPKWNQGKVAVHELAHWLGIRHMTDGTCSDDYVTDTPPQDKLHSFLATQPTHPYHVGYCSGNSTGEMFMNYMDYCNDVSLYMFTNGQKARMHTAMANSPFRVNVNANYNSICNPSTGTNDFSLNDRISIYPNPSTGDVFMNIDIPDISFMDVTIFNSIGAAVLSKKITVSSSKDIKLNLNDKPDGIYLMEIKTSDGNTTKKIVINK